MIDRLKVSIRRNSMKCVFFKFTTKSFYPGDGPRPNPRPALGEIDLGKLILSSHLYYYNRHLRCLIHVIRVVGGLARALGYPDVRLNVSVISLAWEQTVETLTG